MEKSSYFENVVAIVPAAGQGTRLGLGPKAFLRLGEKTVLQITVERLSGCVRHIMVGVPPGLTAQARHDLGNMAEVYEGGSSRQETVFRIFEKCTEEFVLIHDAVRPFASLCLIEKVIQEGMKHEAVISAIPVHTPVCAVYDNTHISETIPSEHAFVPQSPQIFHRDILKTAFNDARRQKAEMQTIWQLVLKTGTFLRLVRGEEENIKITTPFDWEIATRVLFHEAKNKVA